MNKTPKEKIKKAGKILLSVSEKVLLGMAKELDDIAFLRTHQGLAMAVGIDSARAMIADEKRVRVEQERKRSIWRLRRREWITQKKVGEGVEYAFTKTGKIAMFEIIIAKTTSLLPEEESCLVSFDFPNAASKARQMFRRLLKRVGFKRAQQSLWTTDKNVVFEIRALVSALKIEKWVFVYLAKKQ